MATETGSGVSKVRAAILIAVFAAGFAAMAVLGPFSRPSEAVDAAEDAGAAPRQRVAVAVAPSWGPEVLPGELEPVARYLGRELEIDVELTQAASYREAAEAVVTDRAGVGVLPALSWVQAAERSRGLRLLAIQSFESSFSTDAVLVVRAGDEPTDPSGLRGREVCFVDPDSASGHLLARSWARSQGRDPETFFGEVHWSGDHLAALRDLDAGRCDVAAVSGVALEAVAEHGPARERFRVAAITGHLPLAAWAGAPGLDDHLARAISDALEAFAPAEDMGREQVGRTLRIEGFRNGDRSSYRAVWVAAQLEGMLRPSPP